VSLGKNLSSEMQRIEVDTALIINSQAIDEYPLWSPDSEFIAANIQGQWYKFRLNDVKLIEANWHKQKIGVITGKDINSLLTKSEEKEFRKKLNYDPRIVTDSNGNKIELRLKGFSTSLVLTKNNESELLWNSGMENCHSLSVSPNERYVAYLCELNGLFVMKIK
jgi:hypothetical protein